MTIILCIRSMNFSHLSVEYHWGGNFSAYGFGFSNRIHLIFHEHWGDWDFFHSCFHKRSFHSPCAGFFCKNMKFDESSDWNHGFLTPSLHTLPRIHGTSTGKALLRWDLIFPHSLPAELLLAGLKKSHFWVVGEEFVNIQLICLSWHWALRALSITVQTDIFRLDFIPFRHHNLRI